MVTFIDNINESRSQVLVSFSGYIRVSSAPTASHHSTSAGQITIMWQRYTDPAASFISGYRVVCSYTPTFASSDIINYHSGSTSARESSLTLSNLDPSTPLYVRVQVVRTINGLEAVDELSSPSSALICPGSSS